MKGSPCVLGNPIMSEYWSAHITPALSFLHEAAEVQSLPALAQTKTNGYEDNLLI